jgi:hypothetical protein
MDDCSGRIIWLASYPKSGNTWFRVFYTNLISRQEAPARIDELEPRLMAGSRTLFDEYAGVNASNLTFDEIERIRPQVYETLAREEKKTIFIKIHDAYTQTGQGVPLVSQSATRGAIYFIRNPLDVAVSFAHHNACDVQTMIEKMADNQYSFCAWPNRIISQLRQRLLSWSAHVTSWVDGLGPDLHLMRYEDMVLSPVETFSGAVRFARLPDDPKRIQKALAFSDIGELQRQEKACGFKEKHAKALSFFRKGTIGAWREVLTRDQVKRLIDDHRDVMKRFGYLNDNDEPVF